jgi:flagellar biosynthetic protein FlhB
MSDETSAQERTEQPTPKRLLDARRKGQVPRSRDLNTVAVVLAGGAGLLMFGNWMFEQLRVLMVTTLAPVDVRAQAPAEALGDAGWLALIAMGPLLVLLLVASLAGPALMGGLIWSGEAAQPKLSRLDPLAGMKRIFSIQALKELVTTLLKFAVLTGLAAGLLWSFGQDVLSLGYGPVEQGIAATGRIVLHALLLMTGGLLLIAAIDAPFQFWSHRKQLRMTRQEIRDEFKESEGSPELKGRVRQVQREMARQRMMAAVPDADVVITNPTHYAVALKYSDRPDQAPRVVAKGQDLVAARIRELAAEHAVPICSAPPLARAIYFNTEIDQEIPAALYLAVARVLAWVFQVTAARRSGAHAPAFPVDLPVPDELLDPDRKRR